MGKKVKNILVCDVAAGKAGALAILKDFYDEVTGSNADVKWIFVVSTPKLPDTNNVEVIRFPWVKRSWLHRIWFEQLTAPGLVKKYKAGLVFSLQNIIIPRTKIPQVVYVHQPLPFIEHRFGFSENRLFWIYQNIIAKKIYRSIRGSLKTIVQTKWMKEACVRKAKAGEDKVEVIPPVIKTDIIRKYADTPEYRKVFFYPAAAIPYKNHMAILRACGLIKRRGITDYKVVFSLSGHENPYSEKLLAYARQENLNVEFTGALSREEVFSLYATSVLVFPSLIETFGLPLLEARTAGTIIIASDMPFCREVLGNYDNAYFCSSDDAIADIMARCMEMKIKYTETVELPAEEKLKLSDLLLKMI